MWEAEPHHSVCHPVSLNSCSCLLTVILICTQRGAGLQAVFILPPQSQAHGRLHTSYFSSANPRTFAFDFHIVLMSSCFLPPSLPPFQHCFTKTQVCWTSPCPRERDEQATKPHNPSRGADSWLDILKHRAQDVCETLLRSCRWGRCWYFYVFVKLVLSCQKPDPHHWTQSSR